MVSAHSTQRFYGLSTDQKPTENVGNGDCFVEIDTGKLYFFDEANKTWEEWVA